MKLRVRSTKILHNLPGLAWVTDVPTLAAKLLDVVDRRCSIYRRVFYTQMASGLFRAIEPYGPIPDHRGIWRFWSRGAARSALIGLPWCFSLFEQEKLLGLVGRHFVEKLWRVGDATSKSNL